MAKCPHESPFLLLTLIQLEFFPFILTLCLLSFNQLLIHFSRLPCIPLACSFFLIFCVAPFQMPSQNLNRPDQPSYSCLDYHNTSSKKSNRFVKHERPFVKPCWLLLINLFLFRCSTILSFTIRSSTLHIMDVDLITAWFWCPIG